MINNESAPEVGGAGCATYVSREEVEARPAMARITVEELLGCDCADAECPNKAVTTYDLQSFAYLTVIGHRDGEGVMRVAILTDGPAPDLLSLACNMLEELDRAGLLAPAYFEVRIKPMMEAMAGGANPEATSADPSAN